MHTLVLHLLYMRHYLFFREKPEERHVTSTFELVNLAPRLLIQKETREKLFTKAMHANEAPCFIRSSKHV